jgi:hypothetical protein
MAIQKNFVIKNGIQVNHNLIFADTNLNKVGIATTNPQYTLDVKGGIGATNLSLTGIATIPTIDIDDLIIDGSISIGNTTGSYNQFLVSTGTGVTWTSVPTVRSVDVQTASSGIVTFNTSYVVGLLDVYINGVKLSAHEYTANDSATVILDDPCFGGETVEFITYSPLSIGFGATSLQGITILDEGSVIGNPMQITSINFVGAEITASGSGVGVTVSLSDYVASSGISSYSDVSGISTFSGISTYSSISGIATVSGGLTGTPNIEVGIVTASGFTSGVGVTNPVQIQVLGNVLTFNVVGVGSTTFTLF